VIELPVFGEDCGGQVNGVRVLAADIGVCARVDNDIASSGLGSIK
jgi:hypothetical protein